MGARKPCDVCYFYPRSPCGERLWPGLLARPFFIISIHALLAESDIRICQIITIIQISIHALLAESDVEKVPADVYYQAFLSTLSLRRATTPLTSRITRRQYFYPRSPCGERRGSGVGNWPRVIFLSTLSLRRATAFGPSRLAPGFNFYPRSPCGERHTS